MNGAIPAILNINYHDTDGVIERYSVTLFHPNYPGSLGQILQEVHIADRQIIDEQVRQLTEELSRSEGYGETNTTVNLTQKLQGLGRFLCATFIPPGISEALKGSNVPLVISTELNNLPWELLHLGEDNFLALKVPFVRNLAADYKPGAREELRRERSQPIHAFLASNPGQLTQLHMVHNELATLDELLQSVNVEVKHMGREIRDRIDFLASLADRQFTLVHFAGHGHFNTQDPAQSCFWVLTADRREEPVTAEELYRYISGAPIFFLNACESARESDVVGDFLFLAESTKGFATFVISGGAIAFVGAQWPVLDMSAALFGCVFYQHLLAGSSIGEAMLFARQACATGEIPDQLLERLPEHLTRPELLRSHVTWANFILYGQPHIRLI